MKYFDNYSILTVLSLKDVITVYLSDKYYSITSCLSKKYFGIFTLIQIDLNIADPYNLIDVQLLT